MLRDRRLKVSGRKAKLIERLCEADAGGMGTIIAGVHLFRCTESGQSLAKAFLAYRDQVERAAFDALCERNADVAVRVVCEFEDALGFPEDPMFETRPDVATVRSVFAAKPKILTAVSAEVLERLRVAAGMALLGLGRNWLPGEFQTGLAMDNAAAARMIVAYVQTQRQIESAMLTPDLISGVHFMQSYDGSCPACAKLKGVVWKLGDQPELPLAVCTNRKGCCCTISFDYVG